MTSRDTSADEFAESMRGYRAYEAGRPFDRTASQTWQDGWLAAAQETVAVSSRARTLIAKGPDLMVEARTLARAISRQVKVTPSDKRRANQLLHLIDQIERNTAA